MIVKPYEGKPFETVAVVIAHLESFPYEWIQYTTMLECYNTKKSFCKIYTGNNTWKYMMANQDVILIPTLKQRFKLWNIIRKNRSLIKKSGWGII